MPVNWRPADQPPQSHSTYWQQLQLLVQQSLRPPHPGLPVVTTRSDEPRLPKETESAY